MELFYLESGTNLSGLSFNDYLYPNTGFGEDSINNKSMITTSNSALASYWPYVACLDSTGVLSVVMNVPYSETNFSPESNWTVSSLDVSPMVGSILAIVPLGISMSSLESSEYGVFYQDADGYLARFQPIVTESWPSGKNLSLCSSIIIHIFTNLSMLTPGQRCHVPIDQVTRWGLICRIHNGAAGRQQRTCQHIRHLPGGVLTYQHGLPR